MFLIAFWLLVLYPYLENIVMILKLSVNGRMEWELMFHRIQVGHVPCHTVYLDKLQIAVPWADKCSFIITLLTHYIRKLIIYFTYTHRVMTSNPFPLSCTLVLVTPLLHLIFICSFIFLFYTYTSTSLLPTSLPMPIHSPIHLGWEWSLFKWLNPLCYFSLHNDNWISDFYEWLIPINLNFIFFPFQI